MESPSSGKVLGENVRISQLSGYSIGSIIVDWIINGTMHRLKLVSEQAYISCRWMILRRLMFII